MGNAEKRFQERSVIKQSGPIKIAECDCRGCEGISSLNSELCRRCIFSGLGVEEEVDRVTLKRSYKHIYPTSKVSKLAKRLAALKVAVWDRSSYSPKKKGEKCEACIDRRMKEMKNLWPDLLENPQNLFILNDFEEKTKPPSEKCADCTEKKFLGLIRSIKSTLNQTVCNDLSSSDYDEVLKARVQPFFVEGIWKPPEGEVELIDSYDLPKGRGKVKIYQQKEKPVPFYQLNLPEFELSDQQIKLLDEAYRMKIESAPNQAHFARPNRMLGFAEDWYNALLHIVEEKSDSEVPSSHLQELAERMANWLTYRIFEPLSHDENLTDIYIEAPPEIQPIRVVHQRWGHCETGIHWSSPSLLGIAETLASKLGRSFDEPDPQLDAEISELGLRLFISRYPAIWTKNSAAAAIRKRRKNPWTQPLFIEKGSITPIASAFVSNLIRSGASIFTIGDIGTAKTSYLISQIPEIGSAERIVAFQDTEELQFEQVVKQGMS